LIILIYARFYAEREAQDAIISMPIILLCADYLLMRVRRLIAFCLCACFMRIDARVYAADA